MTTCFVLAGFALIVFAPCLVALNSTLGEEHSPVAAFINSCKMHLRKIL